MTPAQRLFKRALSEKLAFIPMGAAAAQQAAGPGGQPVPQGGAGAGVPPGPGGAPMDPMVGGMPPGAAPMDPMAGGMPPMDPMAGGMPPMEPMAGGMPPMDPMAGGMPPMDPMAGGMPPIDPSMAGLEQTPDAPKSKAGLTLEDSEVVDKITQRTMDIVRQTLEMVGKAKSKDQAAADSAAKSATLPLPEPTAAPGPISGMPGFDPSMIQGPLKTAAILSRVLRK